MLESWIIKLPTNRLVGFAVPDYTPPQVVCQYVSTFVFLSGFPMEQLSDPLVSSDSRFRILNAARPLFVGRGYDAVSMQEIADAVPLNKATLYHHFQSKDDLFLAVVRSSMSRLYEQIEQFIAEGGSAADQFTRIAVQIFQDSQSELGRLITDSWRHLSIDQQQLLVDHSTDPWALYEQIFAKAIADGEIPPVDCRLAATMFSGLLQGQTWAVKTRRIEPPLDAKRARYLVDVLFAGFNNIATPSHDHDSYTPD